MGIESNAIEIFVGQISTFLYKEILDNASVIIIDANVYDSLKSIIDLSCFNLKVVDWSESNKCWSTVENLLEFFLNSDLKRSDIVLAIGGGLVSDVVGFAASIYMRGIRWQVVASTLLSQVDACLGGKVAINAHGVKNIYGNFHQPEFIYCDINLLSTLSSRDYYSGLAEVCKYGFIQDTNFFHWLRENKESIKNRDLVVLECMIRRCLKIKQELVSCDYKDTLGKREILNFGHTFAHAIESISDGKVNHGEAVAIGMKLACKLSVAQGLLSEHEYEKILQLLSFLKLDIAYDIGSLSLLYEVMLKDKKNKNTKSLRLLLLQGIGKVVGVDNLRLEDLMALEMSNAER